MTRIVADVAALRAMADRLRTISSDLDLSTRGLVERTGLDERTTGSRTVVGALQDFQGSWDEARARTSEGVDASARFFSGAADRFEAEDRRLAAGLNGSG